MYRLENSSIPAGFSCFKTLSELSSFVEGDSVDKNTLNIESEVILVKHASKQFQHA